MSRSWTASATRRWFGFASRWASESIASLSGMAVVRAMRDVMSVRKRDFIVLACGGELGEFGFYDLDRDYGRLGWFNRVGRTDSSRASRVLMYV